MFILLVLSAITLIAWISLLLWRKRRTKATEPTKNKRNLVTISDEQIENELVGILTLPPPRPRPNRKTGK
jgi:FtsZ-interacting cell division protein ZipA